MLHYLMRRLDSDEGIALVRINAKEHGDMRIGKPRRTRFGYVASIERHGQHVYNLIVEGHDDVQAALHGFNDWILEEISQSEWETHDAFELFPVLKTGLAERRTVTQQERSRKARQREKDRRDGARFKALANARRLKGW